ncbi:hypothetical protein ACP70R_003215 [Stipagrostis hirtigluma subsp. patula]
MVTFTARRREPELVTPARPTPRELKDLSDIDCQGYLRRYNTLVEFFRGGDPGAGDDDAQRPGRESRDPVAAIRSALADALVYFYPFAGRLRELPPDGRLVAECTAEGVVFVAADADVTLAELGEPLRPPYPCVDELLCDLVGDSNVILGKRLCFFQVTRFRCGGFAVGVNWCHVMSDGFGTCKFLEAVGDIARGMAQPAVLPVWEREILTSRAPPRVTSPHLAYEPLGDAADGDPLLAAPPGDMVARYFFFGPAEISAMRGSVGELARSGTVFELLAAAAWRCRTAALGYAPGRRVRFVFTSNARRRGRRRDAPPAIPRGYYGNALVFLAAEATAGELRRGGLRHALQLVRGAKLAAAGDEHLSSTVHLLARRGWPAVVADRTYVVSDVTAIGEDSVDFGWGRRAGGGILMAGDIKSKLMSCFTRCKNSGGEDCTVVPMYLPRAAMDRFAAHIASVCSQNPWNNQAQGYDHVRSSL